MCSWVSHGVSMMPQRSARSQYVAVWYVTCLVCYLTSPELLFVDDLGAAILLCVHTLAGSSGRQQQGTRYRSSMLALLQKFARRRVTVVE